MIVVFLLCVMAGTPAVGITLDVCATCHPNATCDDKSNGSGKVCNCKYGFVGNGRTFCQDKDECQIGASKICGQHTTCHNTYGSYYCTCLSGYSPSNNMAIFIPNDGTHCQDIDECRITGICGEGGQCRNLEGTFECSCRLGYQVHNGAEPFHPQRDKASCKVVDCGQPATVEDSVLLSVTGTTYGSVATFVCDEGFIWSGGDNTSVCGANGLWRGPTMVCEEILCGDPPTLPHTGQVWNGSSTPGSTVTYHCKIGFYHSEGNNVSMCTINGSWTKSNISCKEVHCGVPPPIPHSVMLWDKMSIVGSRAVYQCKSGYRNVGEGNVSVCTASGEWDEASLLCEVVDCGQPATVEDSVLLSVTGTTYGSVATFVCDEGFIWSGGDNTSVCGANGLWRGPTMVCEEVDCGFPSALPHSHILWNKSSGVGAEVVYQCNSGYHNVGKGNVSICTPAGQWEEPLVLCQEILCGDPPTLPHTDQVWNGSSTPGSTVTYHCKIGFYHSEGNNVSMCTINGSWSKSNISCKEVHCGVPPPIPHSVMLWDKMSIVGSRAVYQCKSGYRNVGEGNVSVCTASGEWDEASLLCEEIICRRPGFKPHTKMLWDGTSHIGSMVYYKCDEGYHTRSLKNYSVCGENGQWEDIDLWCEEKSCGPPLILPHTNLLWDHTSRPGSVVLYECMDGFHLESGNNISVCSISGEWGKISLKCRAKCGPIPFVSNSVVVCHNRSVVIHRCVDGYHSWRGSNVSVCGNTGVWQEATLKCIEIKPPINHLYVLNEKCVHWKAEKYEEDTEVYKVTYIGSRDYQRSFHDKRKQFLSSKADQLELCLNLHPVTNYSISITAVSARFTATITANTSLPAPPAPLVYYREYETLAPTLSLHRSANTLDPISLYQVFVLPVEEIMVFDCSFPGRPNPSSKSKSSSEYISAQILVRHIRTEMNFTVGDGLYYGGFYNAPLENGRNYYIILRAVSRWKTALKSSCVLWAKIRGTSYVLRVLLMSAAASVGLVALAILGGYSCIWFVKKI